MQENKETKLETFIFYILCDNPKISKLKLKRIERELYIFGLDKIKEMVNATRTENTTRTISEIKSLELKEKIENFEKVLKENFKQEDIHNFLYNREWLQVIIKKFSLKNVLRGAEFVQGQYDVQKNQIILLSDHIKDASEHEFFHMASTDIDSNNLSTGFSLEFDGYNIGDALNEGYTQLLTERYFNDQNDGSYELEKAFAKNLETIVGNDRMQSLYLKADFFGLVEELTKYYTEYEIEEFLVKLDVISNIGDKNFVGTEEINKINKLIEDNVCFLLKGYCKKLVKLNISLLEMKELIIDFLFKVNIKYNIRDNEYYFDINRFNEIIRENLSKELLLELDVLKTEDICYNK